MPDYKDIKNSRTIREAFDSKEDNGDFPVLQTKVVLECLINHREHTDTKKAEKDKTED